MEPSVCWKAKSCAGFSAQDGLNAAQTLEQAYELAHELEHSEVNTVFEFILSEYMEQDAQRDFVTAQLKQHAARLEAIRDLW